MDNVFGDKTKPKSTYIHVPKTARRPEGGNGFPSAFARFVLFLQLFHSKNGK